MRNLLLMLLTLLFGAVNASENDDFSIPQQLLGAGKITEAILLFEKYANEGSSDAAYVLGTVYESEDSFFSKENKLVKAVEWYKVAAEGNHARAQYKLGSLYYTGSWRGKVDQDLDKALKWFKFAAKQGHSKAQFKLGNLYCWFDETIDGYAWFTVVINQGDNSVKKERSRICKNLTPEIIRKANNLAKQYLIDYSSPKTP